MHFSSLIYILCFSDTVSEVANSFEHLIKTMQSMYKSKAIIRAKVALQGVSFY